MSSARALLRAKRTEAQISHPLAQYNALGQLRCIACQTIVKQSAQWAGHVGSKAHRVSVARMKEEEQRRQQKEEEEMRRRELEEEEMEERSRKRKATEEEDMVEDSKRRRVSAEPPNGGGGGGFPEDFFSDPSQGPVLLSHQDDDDADQDMADVSNPPPNIPAPPTQKSVIDLEFEMFQKEIAATVASTTNNDDDEEQKQDAFHRATVFAEPVMASEVPEGFPPTSTNLSNDQTKPLPSTTLAESTEEDKRRLREEEAKRKQIQKEQDERELIMDRLMEEERAQEEADEKVRALKDRVEAFKKRRAVASSKKK